MHRNYICSLIVILPNIDDSGDVISCNRFLFEDDVTFHSIIRCAPNTIKGTLMDLKDSGLLRMYALSDPSLDDFKRIAGYDSSEFEIDKFVTQEQFVRFLVDNPLFGVWAKKELNNFRR